MMRAAIVAEAREWLGTRWRHQACVKGLACDCIGLVAGVALALGSPEAQAFLDSTTDRAYGRVLDSAMVDRVTAAFLDHAPTVGLGDILRFRCSPDLQHFGIVSSLDPLYVIHAYAPSRKVVENIVDAMWQSRIVGAYRFRGLAD